MVEVHPDPDQARSDGDQSVALADFPAMVRDLARVADAGGRPLGNATRKEQRAKNPG